MGLFPWFWRYSTKVGLFAYSCKTQHCAEDVLNLQQNFYFVCRYVLTQIKTWSSDPSKVFWSVLLPKNCFL